MSQTIVERAPLNGVDVPTLFATINAVAETPELAQFRFRATNAWVSGTHSRTSIHSFHGAGGEQQHTRVMTVDADHPTVLVGGDNAPLPVELILAGLASCLAAGIGNIASARGVTLTSVTSSIEGEIDIRGILGLSDEVRNGFRNIRVSFEIEGDAPSEKLAEIVEQSRRRSAVYDVLTNGVPVDVTVNGR